jgi:acyl-CoA synthetase (AMP-forming)/AMP-acid ligase II
MVIVGKILSNGEVFPEKVAVHNKNEPKTYAMLCSDIKRMASKLEALGVKKQQHVVVVADNHYGFVCAYFAIHLIGATSVSLAPDVDEAQRAFIIEKIKPSFIIDDSSTFIDDISLYPEIKDYFVASESVSEIVFTSGTTGDPKGVKLTHAGIWSATKHIVSQVKNNSTDIELLLMPLSHSFGMARMRTTLFVGGTLVLGYPLQRLKKVFEAIEVHKVTGLGLVPSAWKFITQMSRNMIASYSDQIRYIEFGSADFSPEDKNVVVTLFPRTHIVMHYGLTEVSRALFTDLHHDDLNAVGNLSRGASVIIVDEAGLPLANGEIGEISLQADWVTSGYFEDAQLTNASFINNYFRTGDQGYLQDNYLYLTGRIKEIINVGGKKVSPYRIEKLMNDCDFVQESACAGFPDKHMGEVVHAFIVLNPSVQITADAAATHLKDIIASILPVYMRPDEYHFIESLPKTSTGKIQRIKLIAALR